MLLTPFGSVPGSLDEEFYRRIKYNFKLHLLLWLKNENWDRKDILQKIVMLEGYNRHKVVKYRRNWVHIHIKFMEEQQTEKAAKFLKSLSPNLAAVCVDYLLRDWFSFETRSGCLPPWTLAIVDIHGTTPKSMNCLTQYLLNYMLKDFGQPFLSPYTAALQQTHVQVLFYSMTEALAACMALGHWYRVNERPEDFVYRVRINPSKKESDLISSSGGTPEDTFLLDYFITTKSKIGAAKSKWNSMNNFRTPVMCVPVLMNGVYPQTFVVSDHLQVNKNLAGSLPLHTACAETAEPETLTETSYSEIQACSNIYASSGESSGCSYQSISQHSVYQEGEEQLSNPTQPFNIL